MRRGICAVGLVVMAMGAMAWTGCNAESSCDPTVDCVPELPIASDAGPDAVVEAADGGG